MNQPIWVETYRGRRLDLRDVHPADIDIEDIAHSLSRQCRFNGHCRFFYSVAHHSLAITQSLHDQGCSARIRLLGLLHDAQEAYIGDIITPVKRVMPELCALEDQIALAVRRRFFDRPPSGEEERIVKKADRQMLLNEAALLMPSKGGWWGYDEKADGNWQPGALDGMTYTEGVFIQCCEMLVSSEHPCTIEKIG